MSTGQEGMLPKGWRWVKCQEVIDVRDGTHDTPRYVSGGIPLITSKNLTLSGIDFDNAPTISREDYLKIQKRSAVSNRDILFAMIGTIGNPVIVNVDREFSIKNVALFKFTESVVHPEYFKHLLDSQTLKVQLNREERGGNQKFVALNVLRNLLIPLPPLPEQRRIAAILDKADSLRKKRRLAITKLGELLKSVFIEMFGDPVTNPKGWPTIKIGQLLVADPSNGLFRKNEEYGGSTPVVWVKELFDGHVINTKISRGITPTQIEVRKYGLLKGDLLFCRSSLKLEGIGYNNVFDGEDGSALFECHLIRISPDQQKSDSYFLNFLLRLEGMRKKIISRAKTVTMTTITQENILEIEIILPPVDLQRQFGLYLQKIISIQNQKIKFLHQSDNLFASLQHDAFSNELFAERAISVPLLNEVSQHA